MGDYAYLTVYEATSPDGIRSAQDGFECKYWVPLFWEAMFSDAELRVDDPQDDGPHAESIPRRTFVTDRLSALSRVREDRANFVDHGPVLLACYEAWLRFLESGSFSYCRLDGAVIDHEPGWMPSDRTFLGMIDDLSFANDSEHFAGMLFGYYPPIEVPELTEWRRQSRRAR